MEMVANKTLSAEQQKKNIAEKLWLKYFNQTLYEQGLITESERNRIINLIDSRKPSGLR